MIRMSHEFQCSQTFQSYPKSHAFLLSRTYQKILKIQNRR